MKLAELSAAPALDASKIPLALYVHFPWCVRKCPYCDFNSHALRGASASDIPEDAYIDALLLDLDFELSSELPAPRAVSSIFMGGGTPSLFSGRALARFLDGAARRLSFAADIEITLEANPGTVDEAHFRDYRAAGINRLSLGVQSMDAVQLKRLGRIHDPAAVVSAVAVARRAGFDNLNLDLMFALPQQTPSEADADLAAALALSPEHLSYYQLTLEPNTEFAAHPPPLPVDDDAWAMQERGLQRLAAAGFTRYEVSAYARKGRRARHNLNYWRFGDYLGIGAGAHAKISGANGARRRARHKHPKAYLETAGSAGMIQEDRLVAREELVFEFCMNALRLDEGFAWSEFESRTGLDRALLAAALADAQARGLVRIGAAGIAPTALGLQHLNTLLTGLL
ncbi:MAG: oxygen-independent coproporphyrinogen oxidase-like protein [Hydrocarboniphaga sp.]|uniref:radical SAM family heme chaperone HemW n=1 Tax=Hydrocarboniphaga sp. TaxID=2033016 RepID=UPI002605B948|nr:radical SAM family heme chaperone HemW [Hydrocarboniphaga sp.]MDB5972023.1 oxygen-independent coproporphyrinogen oxidase-like protein [Hydrocarboniphaga sp.]